MASTGTVNFGGLISGLDTNKIIDDLMNVDSKPLTRLVNQKTDLTKKKDTFTSMKSQLIDLKTSISGLKSSASFGAFSASSSDEEALTLSASSSANAGTYKVKVLSLAQAETLSSSSFSDTDSRLGLKGDILVNGKSLSIRKSDTLQDIRSGINTLDAGVDASILQVAKNDNRLIISARNQGSDGLIMANVGGADILGSLGFTDGTVGIRSISEGKVLSSTFSSTTSTIGSLTGISSNVSGNVGIRGKTIAVNLSRDTLSSIRDKINGLGLDSVSAAIESLSGDGTTSYRLAVTGTENFSDDNNILETLGILEGGMSSVKTAYETAALSVSKGNGNGKTTPAELSTKLTDLGSKLKVSSNETVTISGTDSSGAELSKTLTITASSTIADVLAGIESAFSGEATAELQNGTIVVESAAGGKTSLQFNITANNENGGTLDFGTVTRTAQGRERQIVAGTDATITVNNVEVTRSANEVNDVLAGLNLTLKKADPDTEIIVTVVRNDSDVQKKMEDFVEKYNKIVDLVKENSTYDKEKKVAGPLLGDQTTSSIMSRLRTVIGTTVYDGEFAYNQLAQIGIESTIEGKLSLDTATLKDAMDTDMESVVSLFTATRLSSDSDISFVYNSEKTIAGTYDVAITRAAEKAQALSDIEEEIHGAGTIHITDNYGNTIDVGYTEDMNFDDIANAITSEAEKTYAGIFSSNNALKTAATNEPITQTTKISDISGVQIKDNDTITISGTTRTGREYQRIITLKKDSTTTVQTILNTLEDLSDNDVNATIDENGSIQIQDTEEGANNFEFSIQTTVKGLDFGTFTTVQEGRNRATIEATVNDDDRLEVTHLNYGSKNTFTISGATDIGITNGVYAGVDIAGTINDVEGTGSGQALTASSNDDSTRGIVINSGITPEELADEGTFQGTITLISGVADLLYNKLQSITNPVGGFIQAKIDGFDRSISSLNSSIANTNKRLSLRRVMYVRKFTELERAMARLQATQQRLTSSLLALGTSSLL